MKVGRGSGLGSNGVYGQIISSQKLFICAYDAWPHIHRYGHDVCFHYLLCMSKLWKLSVVRKGEDILFGLI